jgi:hypothetical protein
MSGFARLFTFKHTLKGGGETISICRRDFPSPIGPQFAHFYAISQKMHINPGRLQKEKANWLRRIKKYGLQ